MAQPTIAATLSLSPPNPNRSEDATLTITAILSHYKPITICTWKTLFGTDLSQQKAFVCTDLTSDASVPVCTQTNCSRRRPWAHAEIGGENDQWFHTLEPGQPVEFALDFAMHQREGEPYRLKVGDRYRFGVKEGEAVGKWWQGRREEVMAPPGEHRELGVSSGPPIVVEVGNQVEFEVLE